MEDEYIFCALPAPTDGVFTPGQAVVYPVPESHLRAFFLRQFLEPTAMGWVLQKADSDRNLFKSDLLAG